jgi:hypothetical protein
MKYCDFLFQKLWVALKRDHQQMEKMQMIVVQKGSITLVSKGGGR